VYSAEIDFSFRFFLGGSVMPFHVFLVTICSRMSARNLCHHRPTKSLHRATEPIPNSAYLDLPFYFDFSFSYRDMKVCTQEPILRSRVTTPAL
jgi:hypothetical protein